MKHWWDMYGSGFLWIWGTAIVSGIVGWFLPVQVQVKDDGKKKATRRRR